jgi:hypothetical protein
MSSSRFLRDITAKYSSELRGGLGGDSDASSDASDLSTNTFGTISDISDAGDVTADALAQVKGGGGASERKQGGGVNIYSTLQTHLEQKDLIIRDMRVSHTQRLSALEEELRGAKHSSRVLKQQTQADMVSYDQQVRQRETDHQTLVQALRDEIKGLQAVRNVPMEMRELRDSLRDLTVTEAVYFEYCGKSEDQQSIREFACVRVYELLKHESKLREALQAEGDACRQDLIKAQQELEQLSREHGSLSRMNKSNKMELLDELRLMEAKYNRYVGICVRRVSVCRYMYVCILRVLCMSVRRRRSSIHFCSFSSFCHRFRLHRDHKELSATQMELEEVKYKGTQYDALKTKFDELESKYREVSQRSAVDSVTTKTGMCVRMYEYVCVCVCMCVSVYTCDVVMICTTNTLHYNPIALDDRSSLQHRCLDLEKKVDMLNQDKLHLRKV